MPLPAVRPVTLPFGLVLSPRAVELVTFPVRATIAFGQASIGVAQLVKPDGPVRLVTMLAQVTAPDRPLGQALLPGGPLDRILEPGGALDRVLAQEGAIDRVVAPGGVLDRLLDREGLLEQLVAEDGIIDRLGVLMVNIDRLGPVLEPLGPILEGVREAADGIDGSARGLDRSAGEILALLEPVVDVVSRLPGARRRRATVVQAERPERTVAPDTSADATLPGLSLL